MKYIILVQKNDIYQNKFRGLDKYLTITKKVVITKIITLKSFKTSVFQFTPWLYYDIEITILFIDHYLDI